MLKETGAPNPRRVRILPRHANEFPPLVYPNAVSPMLDHDALTAAINEARELDDRFPHPSIPGLLERANFPISDAARVRILRGVLDHTSASELFGMSIPSGDGETAETFDIDLVARWLIWEAKRRSASEVASDFAYFLTHRKTEGLKIELLHGLQISAPIDLEGSLRLEPFSELPRSWQATAFAQRLELERSHNTGRLGGPVALIMRFPIRPSLVKPDEQSVFERHKRDDAKRRSLMDAVVPVFTFVGDSAPVVSGSWYQATGRGVPSFGPPLFTGFEDLGIMGFKSPIQVIAAEVKQLTSLFLALSDKSRKRLGVPLRNLNRSRRQYTLDAAAIDLRTALEALLVPAAGQEITFKIALFGAWMLGNNDEERQHAFDRLTEAYRLGSKAVHGGSIKDDKARDLIGGVSRMLPPC
jgi:hypothetical protein